ncbi:MAG TPA: winged helix-turn-helix domain-containing protein [Terriglobales bacterium]|nr:winged helix-turn-helix domain-containing protein [Terriglobales bacterium]
MAPAASASPLSSDNLRREGGATLIRFGPYEVNLESGDLRKFGYKIKLQPKSFLVLQALVEAPGEIVTREELKSRLWLEKTFVEFESSLNVAVRRLREALSDEAQDPTYIETIPRHGYRFVGTLEAAPVEELQPVLVEASAPSAAQMPQLVPPAPARIAPWRSWKLLAPALALLVIVAMGLLWWKRAAFAPSAPVASSIAVLPFADMSPEKNQQYFSDGLAEELLNHLAKTPGLRVAARTSSFQFRDKSADLRDIARKLDVATVLEGSVRKEGNRVRISAELVKAADGFQLWSGTYDRDLNDVFAVQDDIARAISGELRLRLLKGHGSDLPQRGISSDAYNAYLQGRYFYERRTHDDLNQAYNYFRQAVKLDPNYARAWSALAWVLIARAENAEGAGFEEGYREARAAAEKALHVDPGLAEAQAAIGRIKRSYDWDWAGADAAFQKALALEPQNSVVLLGASSLEASLGKFDEAVALNRRAVDIDPLSVVAHVSLGMHAYYAGHEEVAIDAFQKALAITPDGPEAHYLLGLVYLARSQPQQALAEFEKNPQNGQRTVGEALAYSALARKSDADAALQQLVSQYREQAAYQIAEVYAFRGEADRAFQWLEIARLHKDAGLAAIKGDPLLKNLFHDPRYAEFLKKMGLPA